MHCRPHDDAPLRFARMLVLPLAAAAAIIAGCATSDDGGSNSTMTSSGTTTSADLEAVSRQVESQYVIGPAAARDLGYRVDWQVNINPSEGSGIKRVDVRGDSIFVLDGRNVLSRIRRVDGANLWRIPVDRPYTEVLGLTFVPDENRVFLAAGGSLLELDASTGALVGRQQLDKVANTEPTGYGPFLVYGARNGQLVWHNYQIAFQYRAYQVAPSIQLAPQYSSGYFVTVGTNGVVMVLTADHGQQLWARTMLDRVVANPAVSDRAVYVASLDQHLRAYDLFTGNKKWETLTSSPLREDPILIGDDLFIEVPGQGLQCYEALPANSRRGVVRWENPDVGGDVMTRLRENLLVWDEDAGLLRVLQGIDGAVAAEVSLPQVDVIRSSSRNGGEIFAASDDGRVVRLLPRSTTGATASATP